VHHITTGKTATTSTAVVVLLFLSPQPYSILPNVKPGKEAKVISLFGVCCIKE
jgi:hypothetical protein